MDEGFLVLLLGILITFCLVAFFIVVQALFRAWTEATRQKARDSAGRSLAIGLVNALLITALSLGFWVLGENTGIPPFSVVGLILMAALAIGVIFGVTAMVSLVSERVLPETHGWRQMAGGGAMLVLACLTPYVGWFGLLPYIVFRGLGGFIQALVGAWRTRRDQRKRENEA